MSEETVQVPDFMKAPEEEDLFLDPSTEPKSNWFKFTTVGDQVQGILVEEPQYNIPSKFGPQNIYTFQVGEDIVMVGLNPKTNVKAVRELKQADVGDSVAIKLTAFVDTGKLNPAKQLEVRIKHSTSTAE
ncbi:hypothetical protein M0R04_06145 [Candidatus Dojkabacteria bacterium]|jgi:hypothetical protein|nr:hypothetical protein [Candidatus Dojkabacteria bacterium]